MMLEQKEIRQAGIILIDFFWGNPIMKKIISLAIKSEKHSELY